MAISAAHAVSPGSAADNAAANAVTPPVGNDNGTSRGPFLDSLEAVLGIQGVATGNASAGNAGSQTALPTTDSLAKSKSKLKTDNPAALPAGLLAALPLAVQRQISQQMALQSGQQTTSQQAAPAQAAQLQASVNALENASSDITIPALRAAVTRAGAGRADLLQNAATTGAMANAAAAQTSSTASPVAPLNADASAKDPTANNAAADGTKDAAGGDPSKAAGTNASQMKLAAQLAKNAQSPILKGNNADGSKVPNAKLGPHAQKQDSNAAAQQLAQMATEIAATAGATNAPDAAPVAAQAVAAAEVAAKTTASTATPAITTIEAAAMSNSAQAAIHVATPQAQTDAQALPIQFDSQQAKSDSGKADTQSDPGGQDQKTSDGPASNAPSAAQTAADTQQQQPVQPAAPAPQPATTDGSTTANLAASVNNLTATQQAPAQVAVNLHVAPQTQQLPPTTDQATFAALGVAIAAKSRDGEHQFDIKMDPAELGKVDVRISVNASGQAQAHLSVQHQHTLELLQNDKTTLERNLRDAGLNLANNGLNFSLKGEQQPSTPTFNARNRALSISAVQSADPVSATSSASIAPGDSRLDIRV